MTRTEQATVEAVRGALTADLLKPEWRRLAEATGRPMLGHCYAASEAVYHLLGGKAAGYTPMSIRHEDGPHWWVRGPRGEVIDPTAEQFVTPVPYGRSVAKGFLTRQPSKRAAEIIRRIGAL